jgi:dipeptidyl-peptidase-3
VRASANAARAQPLWAELQEHIYAVTPEAALLIGKRADGHVSGYYLGAPPSAAEVAAVQAAAERAGIDALNTRVRKDAPGRFALLVAAADARAGPALPLEGAGLHGAELVVEYGDFAVELARAVAHLEDARAHAANAHQRAMLDGYIESFRTGDVGAHRRGSTEWVKDVGPVVESYIGFVETYGDPYGARAKWEGFTAIVDKERSAKYEKLVAEAAELIKSLPWGSDFEVDEFKKPDFTALEVLSFATGSKVCWPA